MLLNTLLAQDGFVNLEADSGGPVHTLKTGPADGVLRLRLIGGLARSQRLLVV